VDEQIKKSFDFASDVTKQLITLSTGTIALTITFLKEFAQSTSPLLRQCLSASWLLFLLSVFCGLWTMMALTGSLAPRDTGGPATIRGRNVTVPSILQIVFFLAGLVLTIVFGILAVASGVTVSNPKP
jgi:hypothetical protein